MTICITTFNPEQLVFACDQFAYEWKPNVLELFFNGKITFNHTNIKDCIEKVIKSPPKIKKITSHIAIMKGGDVRLNHVTENLDTTKSIENQIISRLKQTTLKPSIWGCEIGSYSTHCSVTSITYRNGAIETDANIIGQTINTFSPEIVDIFQKEYATNLFFAETNIEKIRLLNQFFNKITELYDGLAGGTPIIAIINREGFKWLQQ